MKSDDGDDICKVVMREAIPIRESYYRSNGYCCEREIDHMDAMCVNYCRTGFHCVLQLMTMGIGRNYLPQGYDDVF